MAATSTGIDGIAAINSHEALAMAKPTVMATMGRAFFISAATVSVAGTITCNGSAGGAASRGGGGGGGSGGSVLIGGSAVTIGTNLITATGGATSAAFTSGGGGGAGGVGRIRVQYSTSISGSTSSPTVSSATTGSLYGVLNIGSVDTTNADLAEYYVAGDPSISPGDVVAIAPMRVQGSDGRTLANKGVLRLASGPYDQQAIGIVSTAPGVMLGTVDRTGGNHGDRQLALAGRVPARVSLENGAIRVGDRLTASSAAGVAMKATLPGRIVGIALEDYAGEEGMGHDQIMVFVCLDWYLGDNLARVSGAQDISRDSALLDQEGDLTVAYRGQVLVAEQVQRLAQAWAVVRVRPQCS